MQTIKVYLQESGALATLSKDFPLYRGQYQNVLLNVFVPTSIVAPILLEDDAPRAGTAVQAVMLATQTNGKEVISQPYFLSFVKNITQNNVEYALYQRLLPSAFTAIKGNVSLVFNVVNTQGDEITAITTTQTCTLEVSESIYSDESPIEPTTAQQLEADINTLTALVGAKQDKQDNSLLTTQKTVVGAINGLNSRLETAEDNVESNTNNIGQLQTAVQSLENQVTVQQTFIGNYSGSALPTTNELNGYVFAEKGRNPQNGDTLNYTLIIPTETDKTYVYTYSNAWSYRIIPPIQAAQNRVLGLVEGTASGGDDFRVDIQNGIIKDIAVQDNNGNYTSVDDYLNSEDQRIGNIVSGAQVVGEATKAAQDGAGNNIVATYLTQLMGASKSYVKDYALPRTFNDVYYLGATGITTTEPSATTTVVGSGTAGAGGYIQLYREALTVSEKTFELSKGNRFVMEFYPNIDGQAGIQELQGYFRVTISAKQVGKDEKTLGIALSTPLTLKVDAFSQKVQVATNFQNLESDVLTIADGDMIYATIEWFDEGGATNNIQIASNSTYPATFGLETQSLSLYVDMKEKVRLVPSAGDLISDTYSKLAWDNYTSFAEIQDATIIVDDGNGGTYGTIIVAGGSTIGWLISQNTPYVTAPDFSEFATYLTTNSKTLATATWADLFAWAIENGTELGGGGGITEISEQYFNIHDLDDGLYKLTYQGQGRMYTYYDSTSQYTATSGRGSLLLIYGRGTGTYPAKRYVLATQGSLYLGEYTKGNRGASCARLGYDSILALADSWAATEGYLSSRYTISDATAYIAQRTLFVRTTDTLKSSDNNSYLPTINAVRNALPALVAGEGIIIGSTTDSTSGKTTWTISADTSVNIDQALTDGKNLNGGSITFSSVAGTFGSTYYDYVGVDLGDYGAAIIGINYDGSGEITGGTVYDYSAYGGGTSQVGAIPQTIEVRDGSGDVGTNSYVKALYVMDGANASMFSPLSFSGTFDSTWTSTTNVSSYGITLKVIV